MNYALLSIVLLAFYIGLNESSECQRRQDGSCYENFASGQSQKIERIFDESLTLHCPEATTKSVTSGSKAIKWTFNKEAISASNSEDELISFNNDQSIFTIKNLKVKHAGRYKCKIENSKQIKSSIYIVKVLHEAPKITSEIKPNYYIERGDSYKINCEATGIPKPTVTWTKNDSEIKFNESNGTLTLGLNNELMFNGAILDNTGVYACTAKNAIGEDKQSANVLITIKPQILKTEPIWYLVRYGNPFSVDCRLAEASIPTANVTWKAIKGGDQFDNKGGIDFIGTRLIIDSTNEKHEGTYVCEAGNIAGKDQWEIKIHVCDNVTREHCGDRLNSTHPVLYDEFRMYSNERTHYIKMQGERNLVIYKTDPETDLWTNDRADAPKLALWMTNTANNDKKGTGPYNLHMLTNGTVQLLDMGKDPKELMWDSINGRPPSLQQEKDGKIDKTIVKVDGPMELIMQNDGILRMVSGKDLDSDWKTV